MQKVLLLIFVMGAVFFSCDAVNGPDGNVPVSSISISGAGGATSISTAGGSLQLTASVSPSGATDNSVSWSIQSGSDYASVSATGLVTAISDGTATIKAAANDSSGISATIDIVISGQSIPSVDVTSITLSTAGNVDAIATPGGTLQIQATILPADATTTTLTWSVASGTAGSISTSGLLTATDDGNVTVRATATDGSGVFGEIVITISGQRGVLSIPVYSAQTVDGSNPVILQVSTDPEFGGSSTISTFTTTTQGNLNTNLLPGTYYLRGFHDLDNSGNLNASDLFEYRALYHGGAGISYVPQSFVISAGSTTTITTDSFRSFFNDWAYPNSASIIKVNASYSGSQGTLSDTHLMLVGLSTDPTLVDTNASISGISLETNNRTIYYLVTAGTYYLGGFYDADGSVDPSTPSSYVPTTGDPVLVYDGKNFGSSGDAIVVVAGQLAEVDYDLDDTYEVD